MKSQIANRKSTMALVVLTLAAVAAIAADLPKAVSDAWKFKWAGVELNKPHEATELEWRCAVNSFKPDPVALKKPNREHKVMLVGIVAEPSITKGLVVKAAIDHTYAHGPKMTHGLGDDITKETVDGVEAEVVKRFCPADYSYLSIEVYDRGKLIARKDAAGVKLLP